MGFFALVLVLIERYLKKSRKNYLITGLIFLALSLLCWLTLLVFFLQMKRQSISIGNYYTWTIYLPRIHGWVFPPAVYCLFMSAVEKPRKFPLIPTLIVIVASSVLIDLGQTLFQRLFAYRLGTNGYVTATPILYMAFSFISGVIAGLCATSWMQYIHIQPQQAAAENETKTAFAAPGVPQVQKQPEYSYLEAYKENRKKEGGNVQ